MNSNTDQHTGRFFGVYLLISQSIEKRFKGKCYVGFTVNPNRRINQHNRGMDFGGARQTSNRGPWKMVMIVHNFPNNISALQFEWAWQQPSASARLKEFTDLKRKTYKESWFQYNFRILSRMLNVGPWKRLPLIIRWLEPEYERDFDPNLLPPSHMPIISGRIKITKAPAIKETQRTQRSQWSLECHLCRKSIENPERSRIWCLNEICKLTCHIICLANYIIASDVRNRGHFLPIKGECPICETEFRWADLLQHKYKMQGLLTEAESDDSDCEEQVEERNRCKERNDETDGEEPSGDEQEAHVFDEAENVANNAENIEVFELSD